MLHRQLASPAEPCVCDKICRSSERAIDGSSNRAARVTVTVGAARMTAGSGAATSAREISEPNGRRKWPHPDPPTRGTRSRASGGAEKRRTGIPTRTLYLHPRNWRVAAISTTAAAADDGNNAAAAQDEQSGNSHAAAAAAASGSDVRQRVQPARAARSSARPPRVVVAVVGSASSSR